MLVYLEDDSQNVVLEESTGTDDEIVIEVKQTRPERKAIPIELDLPPPVPFGLKHEQAQRGRKPSPARGAQCAACGPQHRR